jgi:hypothetical protein
VAPALQPGRTTALAPQTPTQTAIAPPTEESATAHQPGTPGPKPHTTPAPASTPSPLDPALPPGEARPQTQTQATAPRPGADSPAIETSVISKMPQLQEETTLLPPPVHTRPRLLAHQLPALGPRVLLHLVVLSVRQLLVVRLRRRMMRLHLLWVRLLRLVLGTVVMMVVRGMMRARVRNFISFLKLQNLSLPSTFRHQWNWLVSHMYFTFESISLCG